MAGPRSLKGDLNSVVFAPLASAGASPLSAVPDGGEPGRESLLADRSSEALLDSESDFASDESKDVRDEDEGGSTALPSILPLLKLSSKNCSL